MVIMIPLKSTIFSSLSTNDPLWCMYWQEEMVFVSDKHGYSINQFSHRNRVRCCWERRQLCQNYFKNAQKRLIKQADFAKICPDIDKYPVRINGIFRSVEEMWRRVWAHMIEKTELCMDIWKLKEIWRFEFLGKIWEKVQKQEMVLKWVLDKR